MPQLADIDVCTGCAACLSACETGALTMVPDAEGYLRPLIDSTACVVCGQCERVCPTYKINNRDSNPQCFAARTRDLSARKRSSSGGVFYELAKQVLGKGGVVYGCALVGNPLKATHVRVDSLEHLLDLHGSKYVQSEIGNALRMAKEDLVRNRRVLFSGTPCQIAGLRSFLRFDCENLLTVELICHGVPSAGMFARLQTELAKAHGKSAKMINLSFRDKTVSWYARAIKTWYADGTCAMESGRGNGYFLAFLDHLMLRPSCYACLANDGRSGADITLGDYWGVHDVHPTFSDDTGCSAVIVHTKLGLDAINAAELQIERSTLESITRANPSYRDKRTRHPLRRVFLFVASYFGISVSGYAFHLLFQGCSWVKRFPRRVIRKLCRTI